MSRNADSSVRTIDAAAIAVLLLLTLGVYFSAAQPLMRQWSHQRQQIAERDALQSRAAEARLELARLKDQARSIRNALATSEVHLRYAGEMNRKIAALTQLADRFGLKVNAVQPGEFESGARFGVVPIMLEGTGVYPRFVAFCRALKRQQPDVAIESLAFASARGSRSTNAPPQRDREAVFETRMVWYTIPASEPAGQ